MNRRPSPSTFEVLTPGQAAERLQIPQKTVVSLCADGTDAGRKEGRAAVAHTQLGH